MNKIQVIKMQRIGSHTFRSSKKYNLLRQATKFCEGYLVDEKTESKPPVKVIKVKKSIYDCENETWVAPYPVIRPDFSTPVVVKNNK